MSSNTFTETQLRIMACLPMISGPLSIIGSSLIINKILSDRKRKLKRMYNRILLGFSVCDVVSSLAYSFSTLPSPSDTPNIWGARGNHTTCVIQGCILQAGFSVIYYNSLLVFYYLFTIRYGISELTLKKYLEPWIHIFIMIMAIVPSILGVCLGMFNNVGNVCFVGDYPKGCKNNKDVECERGEMYYLYLWVTSGWLVMFLFFAMPINLFIISFSLSKQDREIKMKYKYNSTQGTFPISGRDNKERSSIFGKIRHRRNSRIKTSSTVKRARTQAILYIVSSFMCLSWPIIARLIINNRSGFFIVRCLAQFFYPLQGFFNFFNYTRPRVVKLLEQKLANNFLNALYLATFESDDNLRRLRLQTNYVERRRRKNYQRNAEIQNQN